MSLSVAEREAYGLAVCAWCMELRDLTVLEEVVIREARTVKPGKDQVRMGAAWEGTRRQVCWRCTDRAECAAADAARFANDPPYQIERVRDE